MRDTAREARLEQLERIAADMRDIQAALARIEVLLVRSVAALPS
jgi:hypothetical protein